MGKLLNSAIFSFFLCVLISHCVFIRYSAFKMPLIMHIYLKPAVMKLSYLDIYRIFRHFNIHRINFKCFAGLLFIIIFTVS